MAPVIPYVFIQQRPVDFKGYHARLRRLAPDAILCFDLEDSLEMADPALTDQRKAAHRRMLRHLLLTGQVEARRVLIRLNAPTTRHYAADQELLAALPPLHGVMLPKAESAGQVRQVLAELPRHAGALVPLVETRAGWEALPAMLALPDARLTNIAFGHCDFNLSLGLFPFHHHDSPTYWQWIAALDRQLTRTGKYLINSPVLRLGDLPHLRAVLRRLRAYPSVRGQVTLDLAQTRLCAEAAGGRAAAWLLPHSAPAPRTLLAAFEQYRIPGSALALTPDRTIISPHEALAARRHAPPPTLALAAAC